MDRDTGAPCRPGAEGEIWVSGASVAAGYWNRPQETRDELRARLAGDPDRRYLRTGDLGFLGDQSELAVTGRVKHLLIIRGRNVYPQDLELAVEQAVDGVRPGCTAAFGFEQDGQERAGFACELRQDADPAAVVAAIR